MRTTIDSRLQEMATQAMDWQTKQLRWIANDSWNERTGCWPGNALSQTFIRQTPEYRSARDALTYSRNRVTAQLIQKEGPEKVARLARAMGVRESPLEAVPSLATLSLTKTL